MKAKPQKPRSDFPLFAHPAGVWAKKIKGKHHYFGPWSDPQAALEKYLAEKDYLQAGRKPPTGQLTIPDLLNAFMGDKETRLESGEISPSTFNEYQTTCDVISATLSGEVETLTRDDFAELRNALTKGKGKGKGNQVNTLSLVTQKRRLTVARMVFAFANEQLDQNVKYRKPLEAPSKLAIRRKQREQAKRLYSAADIRTLVKSADPHIKAMILLGINAGFGPRDCETLPTSALDLDGGWHNYHRPKTEVDRRCPLWPETVKALTAIDDGPRVFNGRVWSRHIIAREFAALCESCEVQNHGFYSLRRTFETIATTADVSQAVIDSIMGHSRNDMASVYRQKIFDQQLRKCTNHVRDWYLGAITLV